MYKIEQKDYGIKLIFSGFIRKTEMESWSEEMIDLLTILPPKFGILVDMTGLKPLPVESQEALTKTQTIFKEKVIRSATVTNIDFTDMQFKRLGQISGVNDTKKFLNSSKSPDWESLSLDWITNGTDPTPSMKKKRSALVLN